MDRRCLCPPETLVPPWEISAVNPSGLLLTNSDAWAMVTAACRFLLAGVLVPDSAGCSRSCRRTDPLLRYVADLLAQVVLRHLADVDAVQQDRPLGHVVEAGNQVDDRRFAGPGRADEGRRLTRLGR